MLSREARDGLVVVLVGARNPQNIGAAARAMRDFGFHRLRVVNNYVTPFETALLEATSAVGAGSVMAGARRFGSLPEAIADCTLVAGTTAVGERSLQQDVISLQEASPDILAALGQSCATGTSGGNGAAADDLEGSPRKGASVALLFGSEKTGLTREELSHCDLLLTIPLFQPEGRHLSMNLGQAVAVCLYELTRGGFEGTRALAGSQKPLADSGDRERMLTLLLEVMRRTDYARRFPANARVEVVRQLISKLGATRDEAATWTSLLRMIARQLPDEV